MHATPRKVPNLAVDAAVLRRSKDDRLQLLLIRRGHDPFKGCLAFPGGFVNYEEAPENAVLRELKEETNLIGQNPLLVTVSGNPGRDPRKHVVSVMYYVTVDHPEKLQAGDDAASAHWEDVISLTKDKMAFDHFDMMQQLWAVLDLHKIKY